MSTVPPTASINAMKFSSNWLIPTGLLVLTLVPSVAGTLRLTEMAGAPAVVPDGDRVVQSPVALAVHIVSVIIFGVVGAFQFAPSFRRRHRRWHRVAGRILVPCGLVAAVTGLWLTLFLPPAEVDTVVLSGVRVVVVAYMVASLILGFTAVRRRDFPAHRAWMIRGYAIGMGAGTQFFTSAAWLAAVGSFTPASRTGTMTAAWVINAVAAEWIIRRKTRRAPRRPARRPVAAGSAIDTVRSHG